MLPRRGRLGRTINPSSIPAGWSSSTKPAPQPKWRGYAAGLRAFGKIPHGHWKTSTFVAGLRSTALTAPCVIDGPMNGNAFLAYVEQVLAPTLSQATLSCWGYVKWSKPHAQKLYYLPPYSPTSIRSRFAKLKALLRKAAERSVENLWNRIASLLAFQPDECANYFRNSGYAVS
jgi:transposase